MSLPVFLVAPGDAVDVGGRLLVTGDEGRHAVTVRRLKLGEAVECVDGAGWRGTGVVSAVDAPDRLEVLIERAGVEPAPSPRLIVVQAVPKGDRGEVAVETLTEVGADVVVPWAAARCVARWQGERAAKGAARWRRTAREAAKQARRARVPDVLDLADTADVVTLLGTATRAVVLHEAAALRLASLAIPSDGDVVLVVGPEGGLTEDEVTTFAAAGALACRMGEEVLRTSTAGTAAAAVVRAASGRWS
jgi:16S rRNA (uracil1498-N3)-methyltransferase